MIRKIRKRALALVLVLPLLLSACGGETEASTMRLKRIEGTVGVSDDGDKEVAPREDMRLFSGYGVDTGSVSYAWIDLDDVKAVKMDQDSEIAIAKEGRKLEIEVKTGSLFFSVTKPLENDESLNIRTSTIALGIRGTRGWVTQDAAALLEGSVEVAAGGQSVTISAGEMAVMTADGSLEVTSFSAEDIPVFVSTEFSADDISTFASAELENGESSVCPAAGDTPIDRGVVPWAEAGLTDHIIDWGDEALAAKMVEVTGITDRDIILSDVWELWRLDLHSSGIHNISALGELTNLISLDLDYNSISDIAALGNLTHLHDLTLYSNNIADVSALSSLTNLTLLDLGENSISDVSALSSLTNLQILGLSGTNVSDFSPVAFVPELNK